MWDQLRLLFSLLLIHGCQSLCPGNRPVFAITVEDTTKNGTVLVDNITDLTSLGKEDAGCQVLEIKDTTDIVLTADLDTFCNDQLRCSFKTEGNNQCNLLVEIKRTLNYTGYFMQDTYNVTVKEDTHETTSSDGRIEITPAPQILFPICAHGTNFSGGISYGLKDDGDGYFKWEAESQGDSLYKQRAIDREEHDGFTLTLEMELKKDQSLLAVNTTIINVLIDDVDDNLPVFNMSTATVYTLNITDNDSSIVRKPMTTVPPVQGYDPDPDSTGIVYNIKDQEVAGLFDIDQDGQINVTRTIARETADGSAKDIYHATIQVCQSDDMSRCTETALIVYIDDVDNNLPTFLVTNISASVNEHALVGTSICRVSAVDYDKGENAEFDYKLLDHADVFSVDKDGYIIVKSSANLDREGEHGGTLVLVVGTVTRKEDSPGANNVTVTVTLVDVNDHSPQFDETSYTFSLDNASIGDVIGKINVTDLDDGANANVTFDVSNVIENCNNDPLPVSIHNDGTITLDVEPPRCPQYKLLVKACDNPTLGGQRCDVTTVTLLYNRVASGPFRISQMYTVREHQPPGSLISPLNCSGGVGTTYTAGTNDFTVNDEGLLRTAVEFDRELNDSYTFNINVTSTQETCLLNITVQISDINDNHPVFNNTPYIFNIDAGLNMTHVIGIVSAYDVDEGENGDVTYDFLNRVEGFSINATSGEISMDNMNNNVAELTVIAKDGGQPSLQNITSVYVKLITEGTSVYINTPMLKADVELQRENFERHISELLGFTVTITDIQDVEIRYRRSTDEVQSASTVRSKVLLTAGSEVAHEELLSAVVTNYEGIRALFTSPSVPEGQSETSVDRLGAAEIALIAMAAVVLVGAVATIIVVNRQFNSHKRYKQLYENMTRHSSIYESQEIKMTIDDETSDYNGSVKTQDLVEGDLTKSQDLIVTSTNPVYQSSNLAPTVVPGQHEADHVTTVNPLYQCADDVGVGPTIVDSVDDGADENTSVKEIMERLEQLSDRLEQESSTMSLDDDPDVLTDDLDDVIQPPADYITENDNASFQNLIVLNEDAGKELTGAVSGSEQPGTSGEFVNNVDEEEEEPNPDYNIKEVRFSTQVLDADENKLEPLKIDKAPISEDENTENDDVPDDTETEETSVPETDTVDNVEDEVDEAGWSEEQINSPVSELPADANGFYFNGDQDAMTYL